MANICSVESGIWNWNESEMIYLIITLLGKLSKFRKNDWIEFINFSNFQRSNMHKKWLKEIVWNDWKCHSVVQIQTIERSDVAPIQRLEKFAHFLDMPRLRWYFFLHSLSLKVSAVLVSVPPHCSVEECRTMSQYRCGDHCVERDIHCHCGDSSFTYDDWHLEERLCCAQPGTCRREGQEVSCPGGLVIHKYNESCAGDCWHNESYFGCATTGDKCVIYRELCHGYPVCQDRSDVSYCTENMDCKNPIDYWVGNKMGRCRGGVPLDMVSATTTTLRTMTAGLTAWTGLMRTK